jgi:hypothetical protein
MSVLFVNLDHSRLHNSPRCDVYTIGCFWKEYGTSRQMSNESQKKKTHLAKTCILLFIFNDAVSFTFVM